MEHLEITINKTIKKNFKSHIHYSLQSVLTVAVGPNYENQKYMWNKKSLLGYTILTDIFSLWPFSML